MTSRIAYICQNNTWEQSVTKSAWDYVFVISDGDTTCELRYTMVSGVLNDWTGGEPNRHLVVAEARRTQINEWLETLEIVE